MKKMLITKYSTGYEIYDTTSKKKVKYNFMTLNEAINKHCKTFGLDRKQFEKFFNKKT